MESPLSLRQALDEQDPARIRDLVKATGFFNPAELDIAEELPRERLVRGEASGYFFLLAEDGERLLGYTCYGPIAGTAHSYDLYWIAVRPELQRRGLGRRLLRETENIIRRTGGRRVYVETSLRPQYASTRAFYERCGYRLEATLPDFYAPGDGKAIYCKVLE